MPAVSAVASAPPAAVSGTPEADGEQRDHLARRGRLRLDPGEVARPVVAGVVVDREQRRRSEQRGVPLEDRPRPRQVAAVAQNDEVVGDARLGIGPDGLDPREERVEGGDAVAGGHGRPAAPLGDDRGDRERGPEGVGVGVLVTHGEHGARAGQALDDRVGHAGGEGGQVASGRHGVSFRRSGPPLSCLPWPCRPRPGLPPPPRGRRLDVCSRRPRSRRGGGALLRRRPRRGRPRSRCRRRRRSGVGDGIAGLRDAPDRRREHLRDRRVGERLAGGVVAPLELLEDPEHARPPLGRLVERHVEGRDPPDAQTAAELMADVAHRALEGGDGLRALRRAADDADADARMAQVRRRLDGGHGREADVRILDVLRQDAPDLLPQELVDPLGPLAHRRWVSERPRGSAPAG